MANMTFGVNLLPRITNTYTLGNSDYKWNVYINQINGTNLTIPAGETIATTDQVAASKVEIIRFFNTSNS